MDSVRTCLGCRARVARSSLLRFVDAGGTLAADPSGSAPGRGAWVHGSIECLEKAITRKAFGRALRSPSIRIDADLVHTATVA
jgi:predicted RNA-binding protein YlxR (DUF448 family)